MNVKRFFVFLLFISFVKLGNGQTPFVPKSNGDSLIHAVLASISKDSVENIIQSLQDFDTRFALADNRKDVAIWIQEKFNALGYNNVVLDSFLLDSIEWPKDSDTYYTTWQYNVVAKLEGQSDTTRNYILGAHYDAIVYQGDAFAYAPGADDNASGVAAVLETARVLKKHNIAPKHNIYFIAYAAEELYLYGSTYHAQKMASENKDIVLMINNDMIAYNPYPYQPWKFTMQKYPETQWVETLAKHIAHQYTNLQVVVDSIYINYSDSYPYHIQGYDAVFFQEHVFNTNLHTNYDVIDSLDMTYCAEVIKISCGMLLKENLIQLNRHEYEMPETKITLYPNPATEKVFLTLSTNERGTIEIALYDMQGRLIKSKNRMLNATTAKQVFHFDVAHLENGIYTFVITTPRTINYNKIIKIN